MSQTKELHLLLKDNSRDLIVSDAKKDGYHLYCTLNETDIEKNELHIGTGQAQLMLALNVYKNMFAHTFGKNSVENNHAHFTDHLRLYRGHYQNALRVQAKTGIMILKQN